ncbi:MAG: hypothetical protein RSE91_04110, partial [Bacilli bacterium]
KSFNAKVIDNNLLIEGKEEIVPFFLNNNTYLYNKKTYLFEIVSITEKNEIYQVLLSSKLITNNKNIKIIIKLEKITLKDLFSKCWEGL